jgi:protein phosphatase PTC1
VIFVLNTSIGDTHLIIACDGLWDVVSDDEATKVVLENADNPSVAAEKLKKAALDNLSMDNISVMVIKF